MKEILRGRVRFPTGGKVRDPSAAGKWLNRCDSGTNSIVWMKEEKLQDKSIYAPDCARVRGICDGDEASIIVRARNDICRPLISVRFAKRISHFVAEEFPLTIFIS